MSKLEKKIVRLVNYKPRTHAEILYACREYCIRDVEAAVNSLLTNLRIAGWFGRGDEYTVSYTRYA